MFMYVYLQERVVKIVDRLGNIRSVLSVCVLSLCGVFIVIFLGLNPRLKHQSTTQKEKKMWTHSEEK